MILTLLLILAAIVVCMALSFFFSGSETAIISANQYRLRSLHEQGDMSAGKILAMLGNTQRLLVMVLVGTNLANVLTALFFNLLVEHGWPHLAQMYAFGPVRWTELLSLIVLTPLVVMFAEILPKSVFRAYADNIIRYVRPAFAVMLFLMKPVIVLIELFTRFLLTPLGESRTRAMRELTRKDVLDLVVPEEQIEPGDYGAEPTGDSEQPLGQTIAQETAGAESSLAASSDERTMIQNIIQLHETLAGEIMTPLVDLVAVRLGAVDIDGLKNLARATGYSRFPVYRDRIVNVIGYVDIYRLLREADPQSRLSDFMEKPYYVPETKRIDELLQEFLSLRVKNAVVVNEYGGCAGWISREDILEEIVGEFEDELDIPTEPIAEQGEGVFLLEGRTEIDSLNEILGTDFPDDDWDTLAGLLLAQLGRIPAEGEQLTLDDWRVTIAEMDGLRINRVRLERNRE